MKHLAARAMLPLLGSAFMFVLARAPALSHKKNMAGGLRSVGVGYLLFAFSELARPHQWTGRRCFVIASAVAYALGIALVVRHGYTHGSSRVRALVVHYLIIFVGTLAALLALSLILIWTRGE